MTTAAGGRRARTSLVRRACLQVSDGLWSLIFLSLGVRYRTAGVPNRTGHADAATFVAVSLLLTAAGVLASAMPAYRATQVNPLKVLRDE